MVRQRLCQRTRNPRSGDWTWSRQRGERYCVVATLLVFIKVLKRHAEVHFPSWLWPPEEASPRDLAILVFFVKKCFAGDEGPSALLGYFKQCPPLATDSGMSASEEEGILQLAAFLDEEVPAGGVTVALLSSLAAMTHWQVLLQLAAMTGPQERELLLWH